MKPSGMPLEAPPALRKAIAYSRYHCQHCGQPVTPGAWLDLTYRYRGMECRDRACPTCLATQELQPRRPAA